MSAMADTFSTLTSFGFVGGIDLEAGDILSVDVGRGEELYEIVGTDFAHGEVSVRELAPIEQLSHALFGWLA